MNLKIVVLLCFVSLIAISCSSCKTEESADNSEKVMDQKLILANKKSVPMGAIIAKVELKTLNSENTNLYSAEIIKVVKRGRGAPVINANQEINIKFSDKQKSQIEDINNESRVTIRKLENGMNGSTNKIWQLISVE